MKKWRVSASAVLLALMAGLGIVAGCGDDDEEAAAPATTASAEAKVGEGITVGFATLGCENATVCGVNKGFAAQAEAMGATAVVLESPSTDPNTINKTISQMDQLIAQGVDAIAFWPLDPTALNAPADRAKAAGIPVFAHDLYGDPRGVVVTSVTQGRELKAKQAAEAICERFPEGADVLYGTFPAPIPTLLFLESKTKEYLKACSDGKSKVLGTFGNKTDNVDGGRPAAEAALQRFPDADAISNYNDPTAIGASIAADDLGRDVWIDGYNLAPDGVDALKAGRFDISWDYRSVEVGQQLARTMVEYAAGVEKNPPKIIMMWPKAYTTDTIGDFLSIDERVAAIEAGEDLVAAEPDLVQEADTVPTPPDTIPPPDVSGE